MRGRHGHRGITLVETLIALTVFAMILGVVFQIFKSVSGRNAARLTTRLELQLEVRRALVNIFSEIQEGIEIFKPDPGSTLPFLVLRDYLNNLHFLYLDRDAVASTREGCDIFRLYSITYDVERKTSTPRREILANLTGLRFTAHGFGGVLVTGELRKQPATFSFINMIRLKNATAGDAG